MTTMPANLDIATLRSFVLIAQGRKFSETALAVGRSQSAISLQIQKLEGEIGAPVFRRTSTGVRLTTTGERLLGYAQRLLAINDEALGLAARSAAVKVRALGFASDLAESIMADLLLGFQQEHPDVIVTLRIDNTSALISSLLSGNLNLAIGEHREDPLNKGIIAQSAMIWVGREDFRLPADGLLPLAMVEESCPYRTAALGALRGQQQFRLAATADSLSGILSAVETGLSITVRTRHVLKPPFVDIGATLNLPALPTMAFALYARPDESPPAVARLLDLWRARSEE